MNKWLRNWIISDIVHLFHTSQKFNVPGKLWYYYMYKKSCVCEQNISHLFKTSENVSLDTAD